MLEFRDLRYRIVDSEIRRPVGVDLELDLGAEFCEVIVSESAFNLREFPPVVVEKEADALPCKVLDECVYLVGRPSYGGEVAEVVGTEATGSRIQTELPCHIHYFTHAGPIRPGSVAGRNCHAEVFDDGSKFNGGEAIESCRFHAPVSYFSDLAEDSSEIVCRFLAQRVELY